MIRVTDGTNTLQGTTIRVGAGLLLTEDADGFPQLEVQNGGAGTTFDSALNIQATSPGNHRQIRLIDKATATKYNWMIGTQPSGDDVEITPSTTIGGTTFSTPVAVFQRTGNVGIGVTVPNHRLHVLTSGTSGFTGAPNRGVLLTDSTGPRVVFEDSGESATDKIMIIRYEAQAMTFASMDDTGASWDKEYILVLHRDGGVGIGGSPVAGKLTVTDAVAVDTSIRIYNTHGSSRGGWIGFYQGASNSQRGLIGVSGVWLGTQASNLLMGAQTGSTIQFYTDGNATLAMELDLSRNLTVALGGASNTGKLTANRLILPVGADKWAT